MTYMNSPIKIYDDLMYQKAKEYKTDQRKWGKILVIAPLVVFFSLLLVSFLVDGVYALAALFLAMITFSMIFVYAPNDVQTEIIAEVKRARLQFLGSYGLEITDSELNRLNFPNSGGEAEQKVYGIADVIDTKTGSVKKVILKGLNDGSVALFDENSEPLQPVHY